jgi:hypothetical protein
MKSPKKTDPQEILRRLDRALDEVEVPDEEAREICAGMGIDADAVHARLLARVDAFEAEAERKRRFQVVQGGGAGRPRRAAERAPDAGSTHRRKAGSDPGR